MHSIDRWYIVLAIVFALAGSTLGQVMGATGDHSQMPTHAHIMLMGWTSMFLFGLAFRAWPELATGRLPTVQFALHVAGATVMSGGLYAEFAGWGEEAVLGPVLGLAGLAFQAAIALFGYVFVRHFFFPRRRDAGGATAPMAGTAL